MAADATVLMLVWTVGLWVLAPMLFPTSASPSERGTLWASTVLLGVLLRVRSLRRTPWEAIGLDALQLAEAARVAVLTGAWAVLMATPLGVEVRAPLSLLAALCCFVGLAVTSLVLRGWLFGARTRGRFLLPTVIVGAGAEADDLRDLVAEHPELGLRHEISVGLRGDRRAGDGGIDVEALLHAVGQSGVHHVLLAGSCLSMAEINSVVRLLHERGLHVHLSSGLRGIATHRLRTESLAYQPLLYIGPRLSHRFEHAVKRGLDLVLASVLLVVAAPVLALAALAIRLEDRGPIVFRQQRVGHGERTFALLKLRTMVVDAEAALAQLRAKNQRNGPLFKLADDPRITRVGRLLRATSLDEVPQLINVLRGEMSLVGPRPALPEEVLAFDMQQRSHRASVRPGVTGLWQVDGRESPLYSVYVRLDRFYVENWSVWLDIVILLGTVQALLGRAWKVLRPARADLRPVLD